jgi:hypothetical protein
MQRRAYITEMLMGSTFASQRAQCFDLTKKALSLAVLLSSLGLWAALWATAASLASAWLQ